MGRKILFITTDQQRYDAYGCNGGRVARTPVADGLAEEGVRFERAYCQNVVCSPARSSMLTGQYPSTHGVIANGVPLPPDAPSVAEVLRDAGYRTALIGKVHFEPIADPTGHWEQNRLALTGEHGPYRGFDHVEFAGHGPLGASHYANWLRENHPDEAEGFLRIFSAAPGGDTGAPGAMDNPVARGHYHTDWVADRVIEWLDSLDGDEDWFCWMSFPDPHHPWDPPVSERHRVDWRELDLPDGHPGSDERIREILAQRPAHWLAWYDGSVPNIDGAPADFVPAELTHDQIREINALVHIKNELLDEAFGRVLAKVEERGWGDDTDVVLTTDHGEFQGDLGLLFKGPYHVDALMRLPMVWRPARSAETAPAVVPEPVGQIDLAPTFCRIADVPVPDWMQGEPLPCAPGSGRERAIIEWDSQLDTGYRLRTIVRDGWICTVYEPTDREYGMPKAERYASFGLEPPATEIVYDGTEGELYHLAEDPHQWVNRWDDPAVASVREKLVKDLYDHLPPAREPRLRPAAMG
ncbi:arylsulfatase A-like enzyme [Spinactinospora alkalitolerans]|uniref:Arylsulfatase A-like enzyme n=1 Tax=Spinactinospora alkalitolerans TaxID=687207 RepID=A0A852TY10_9ACTN|nr:sulfatase-like hydrolase/transferase [Spinactinospora alkalitolerans]NYE47852.1 arylsulfatase A-like enzyme [Spinactinospora alkalitolerans]